MVKSTRDQLIQLLSDRILIIDGAMGTMIQRENLGEKEYRGEEFSQHPHPLKGNNDLLTITQPQIIYKIHKVSFYRFFVFLLSHLTFQLSSGIFGRRCRPD